MGRTSSTVKDRYNAKAYDEIKVRVGKGQKDTIQVHAVTHGESVNGFIGRAILEAMERDGGGMPSKSAQQGQEGLPGGRVVSLPSETVEAAQRAAKAAGEAVPVFVARAVETQAQRDKAALRLGINPVTGGKLEKEV